MIANRAIKARQKASPDRLQSDLKNPHVIVNGEILENPMLHLAESSLDEDTQIKWPNAPFSVPLSIWIKHKNVLIELSCEVAVQLAGDDETDEIASELNDIKTIVLPLVHYVDGRAYSQAFQLRQQYGYQGEIRAVGDVHFDQLGFLARVGIDAFELAEGEDLEAALDAFSEISEVYQPSADNDSLIFARRRTEN